MSHYETAGLGVAFEGDLALKAGKRLFKRGYLQYQVFVAEGREARLGLVVSWVGRGKYT